MKLFSGDAYFDQITQQTILPTGILALDKLLGGGIQSGMILLLIGFSKATTHILQQIAFNASLQLHNNNHLMNYSVLFVDNVNHFDPYFIAKMAVQAHVNPRDILQNI